MRIPGISPLQPGRGLQCAASNLTSSGSCLPLLLVPVLLLSALSPMNRCAAAGFGGAEPPASPSTIETACTGLAAITVYWSPPVTKSWTGYRVLRNGEVINEPGPGDRNFVDTGVKPGGVYRYQVVARYENSPEGASHTISEKLPPNLQPSNHYDVVVVTASSAGVAAAVTAARKGLRVALLEPTDRLGGIMSNGLCSTDIRRPEHSTGFFAGFREKVQAYYGAGEGLRYEPHVVNNVLKAMVASEPGLNIFYHVRPIAVSVRGSRVKGVTVESLDTGRRSEFLAPYTIDADATGDVTAWSGCRCRVGREARSLEEPHGGVIYYHRAKDALLPGSTGRADERIQAYTYLLVVKDYGKGTDHRIPKPPGYQESDFIHSPRWVDSWAYTSGAMPAGKYELNQHPQGGDVQGINYRWPWESEHRRRTLEQVHRDHVLGYLYYLQTHEHMPNLGLPDDEFPENGGFPETLYVREARRVVGLTTLTERDVTLAGERLRPDSGGVGDYPMDSHAVRPKTDWNSPDMGEGEYWLYRYTPWFQIPTGVVIPRDRDGLLVAEAVSATHTGYGTLRMEPVRMELGEMCANLAAISLWTGVEARGIPPTMLQDRLITEGQQIFWYADVPADSPDAAAIQHMAAHGYWQEKEFHGETPVTRQEAIVALQGLQWMEAAQSGDSALAAAVKRSLRWGAPAEAAAPLSRGQFARWLAAAQAALDPGWSTTTPVSTPILASSSRDGSSPLAIISSPGIGTSVYPDVDPGAPEGAAALVLAGHHITTDTWKNTRFTREGLPYFDAGLPVTRADFAEALYLAQRHFPSPFFHPIGAVIQFTAKPVVRIP